MKTLLEEFFPRAGLVVHGDVQVRPELLALVSIYPFSPLDEFVDVVYEDDLHNLPDIAYIPLDDNLLQQKDIDFPIDTSPELGLVLEIPFNVEPPVSQHIWATDGIVRRFKARNPAETLFPPSETIASILERNLRFFTRAEMYQSVEQSRVAASVKRYMERIAVKHAAGFWTLTRKILGFDVRKIRPEEASQAQGETFSELIYSRYYFALLGFTARSFTPINSEYPLLGSSETAQFEAALPGETAMIEGKHKKHDKPESEAKKRRKRTDVAQARLRLNADAWLKMSRAKYYVSFKKASALYSQVGNLGTLNQRKFMREEFNLGQFITLEPLVRHWLPLTNPDSLTPTINNAIDRVIRLTDGRLVQLIYIIKSAHQDGMLVTFDTRPTCENFAREMNSYVVQHKPYSKFVQSFTEIYDWSIQDGVVLSVMELPLLCEYDYFAWRNKNKLHNDDQINQRASLVTDALLAALCLFESGYVVGKSPKFKLSDTGTLVTKVKPTIVALIKTSTPGRTVMEIIPIRHDRPFTIKRNVLLMQERYVFNEALYAVMPSDPAELLTRMKKTVEYMVKPVRVDTDTWGNKTLKNKLNKIDKAKTKAKLIEVLKDTLSQLQADLGPIGHEEFDPEQIPYLVPSNMTVWPENAILNPSVLPEYFVAQGTGWARQLVQDETRTGVFKDLLPIRLRDYWLYAYEPHERMNKVYKRNRKAYERALKAGEHPAPLVEREKRPTVEQMQQGSYIPEKGVRRQYNYPDRYKYFKLVDCQFGSYFEALHYLHEAGYCGFGFTFSDALLLDITTGTCTLNVANASARPGQKLDDLEFDFEELYGDIYMPRDLPGDTREALMQCDVYNLLCEIILILEKLYYPHIDSVFTLKESNDELYYRYLYMLVLERFGMQKRVRPDPNGGAFHRAVSKHTDVVLAASRLLLPSRYRMNAAQIARILHRPDLINRE